MKKKGTLPFPVLMIAILSFGVAITTFAVPSWVTPALKPVAVYDVPFVPTMERTATEMLRMCRLGRNDVLYDLGCGDGRIVIMAAKEFGARAVGIDIDPNRIRESRANAANAGVGDRVKFVQQNLFEADFSPATVVTLYLLSGINMKLRPLLFEQLRAGTRVVSHDFDMGDWRPDKWKIVGTDTIFYWVVPANASGEWRWTQPGSGREHRLSVIQKFQTVDVRLDGLALRDAKLTGEHFSLTWAEASGSPGRIEYRGKVNGDTIHGTMIREDGTTMPWQAWRDPSTVRPIDESDTKVVKK